MFRVDVETQRAVRLEQRPHVEDDPTQPGVLAQSCRRRGEKPNRSISSAGHRGGEAFDTACRERCLLPGFCEVLWASLGKAVGSFKPA
jgi:hypothetical protein